MIWRLAISVLAACVLAAALPAGAVINVPLPLSKIYRDSMAVVVGRLTRVSADAGVALVDVAEVLKGAAPGAAAGAKWRIQAVAPDGLAAQLAAEQPVVICISQVGGGTKALLHVADTWTIAELVPGADPPTWRTAQERPDLRVNFPGRTVALAAALAELKAGKSTLLDAIDPKVFEGNGGQPRLRATLPVSKPTFLVAADVNGDKQPDLIVGTGQGVKLFLATATGYEDATAAWGLAGASAAGRAYAVGDLAGDGKPGLLLGKTLWRNAGGKFVPVKPGPALPEEGAVLAAALADATGHQRADVLVLLKTGELLVFENPGPRNSPDQPWPARPARKLWQDDPAAPAQAAVFGAWGDTPEPCIMAVRGGQLTRYALTERGGPAADYTRLTGQALGSSHKGDTGNAGGFKLLALTAIDINGDGRPDLFLAAANGSELLVNRGFGAYLVNPDAGAKLVAHDAYRPPFTFSAATPWAAADLHGRKCEDLLVLTEDGKLYELENPPQAGQ